MCSDIVTIKKSKNTYRTAMLEIKNVNEDLLVFLMEMRGGYYDNPKACFSNKSVFVHQDYVLHHGQ